MSSPMYNKCEFCGEDIFLETVDDHGKSYQFWLHSEEGNCVCFWNRDTNEVRFASPEKSGLEPPKVG